jgi:hypothetical protein
MKNIKNFQTFLNENDNLHTYDWRWYADQISEFADQVYHTSGHKKTLNDARSMGLDLEDLWQSFDNESDSDAFYDMTKSIEIAQSADDVIQPIAFFEDQGNWFFGVTEGYDYYRYIYGLDGNPKDL